MPPFSRADIEKEAPFSWQILYGADKNLRLSSAHFITRGNGIYLRCAYLLVRLRIAIARPANLHSFPVSTIPCFSCFPLSLHLSLSVPKSRILDPPTISAFSAKRRSVSMIAVLLIQRVTFVFLCPLCPFASWNIFYRDGLKGGP